MDTPLPEPVVAEEEVVDEEMLKQIWEEKWRGMEVWLDEVGGEEGEQRTLEKRELFYVLVRRVPFLFRFLDALHSPIPSFYAFEDLLFISSANLHLDQPSCFLRRPNASPSSSSP